VDTQIQRLLFQIVNVQRHPMLRPKRTTNQLPQQKYQLWRQGVLCSRGISKQSCMRVGEYAGALSVFFSKAGSGELCFALYGHWGAEKLTL